MSHVTASMAISLDGYMAGPEISQANPLGIGGERLHDWLFNRTMQRDATSTTLQPNQQVDQQVIHELNESIGAVIVGKRTYAVGIDHWQDTPYPVPTFVLTHTPQSPMDMQNGTFVFVTDGIHSALHQAQQAAGAKHVHLMGIETVQQFLAAGLVDELLIHLVPVLLGKGKRLFENYGDQRIELQQLSVRESAEVTHLRFRLVK